MSTNIYTHKQANTLGIGRLTKPLCGHTLDQHHTGVRVEENSSMGKHTGSTSHGLRQVEEVGKSSMGHTLDGLAKQLT